LCNKVRSSLSLSACLWFSVCLSVCLSLSQPAYSNLSLLPCHMGSHTTSSEYSSPFQKMDAVMQGADRGQYNYASHSNILLQPCMVFLLMSVCCVTLPKPGREKHNASNRRRGMVVVEAGVHALYQAQNAAPFMNNIYNMTTVSF